jgi:hypothetical protein
MAPRHVLVFVWGLMEVAWSGRKQKGSRLGRFLTLFILHCEGYKREVRLQWRTLDIASSNEKDEWTVEARVSQQNGRNTEA